MQVRFLRPAEAEVDEAITYFDEQRDGLGERFEDALHAATDFLTRHPLSGKQLTRQVRAFGLRTFRYNLIYVLDENESSSSP